MSRASEIFALLAILISSGVEVTEGKMTVATTDQGFMQLGNALADHGKRLDVTETSTEEVARDIDCVHGCMKRQDCFAVNTVGLTNDNYLCYFLNTTKFAWPQKLVADTSFMHWFFKDFCEPSPCLPGCACVSWQQYEQTGKVCICDPNYNHALNKPAFQVNRHSSLIPARAVDGSVSTCSMTANLGDVRDRWWIVDFESEVLVSRVAIVNQNGDLGIRLSDFEIKIGNNFDSGGRLNPKCGDRHGVDPGATKTIVCEPAMKGRYLTIESFFLGPLTICEVRVFSDFDY